MSVEPGTSLGSFHIVALLGSGGMGEVYRARDTNLDREVALKIVPQAFADDPVRLARFAREAKTLAALNHPNVAQVHGLEQSTHGIAMVMELVPGADLSEVISAGPLPLDEALPMARQIVDALEAAHEQGIVHRDLKPANIKVRPDGRVKVLDFGLAKAIDIARDGDVTSLGPASPSSVTATGITMGGLILGTPAYMAPEQARGKPVDKRADIWAFGCVLYEMLSGRTPFSGATTSDVLAHVLEREPDWSALPRGLPTQLREILSRCLVKDPRQRTRDIGDVRLALENIDALSPEPAGPPRDARRGFARGALPWVLGLTTVTASAAAGWLAWSRTPQESPDIRAVLDLENDAALFTAVGPAAVFAPDGRHVAFVGAPPGQPPQIYLRPLDSLKGIALAGTTGARDPFFSADGHWIGFFADGKLKKVATGGGAAVTLGDAPNDRGGDWVAPDTILFAPSGESVLMQVPAAGGTARELTAFADGEVSHRWPQRLPGGRGVIFTALGKVPAEPRVIAQRISGGDRRVLIPSAYFARYLSSGHLAYMQDSTLYVAPFDADTLTISGSAVPVETGVLANPNTLGAQVAFSALGSMLYVPGGLSGTAHMYWVDAAGAATAIGTAQGRFTGPRVSPDGDRVAVTIVGQQADIWTYEWRRDALSRLTFADGHDVAPVWSPDGRLIAFGSEAVPGAASNVYVQRADGTGAAIRLIESASPQIPASWHPSGRFLAVTATENGLSRVLIAPLDLSTTGVTAGRPEPLASGPFSQSEPAFSPDGRWLAYQSNETGRSEIYVRPFPGNDGRWQVSTAGGRSPIWRGKNQLFFRNAVQDIIVVTYDARGDAFSVSPPRRWSDARLTDLGPLNRSYDMDPSAERALVLGTDPSGASARNTLVFVSNPLKRLRTTP